MELILIYKIIINRYCYTILMSLQFQTALELAKKGKNINKKKEYKLIIELLKGKILLYKILQIVKDCMNNKITVSQENYTKGNVKLTSK